MATALITGAASGIGAATAARFRANGWHVVGLDLQSDGDILVADVANPESVAAAAASPVVPDQLDALVCAAGIWDSDDDRYAKLSLGAWERTWAVNVTGTMLTLRAFGPRLVEGSSVTTVASMAALTGMPRRDAYTASKGAVVALSRAWAADLIRRGTRVNCVCPGVTATPMTRSVLARENLSLPLDRPAFPEEIAEVIVTVSQPACSYLAGAIIPIDGAMTAAGPTWTWTPRHPRLSG